MNRKRRSPIHLTAHATRYRMSKWLKLNKSDYFDVPYLCEQIGMNPAFVSDRNKVYGGILYWRSRFINEYYKWKKAGKFEGKNRYDAWAVMLHNYNQNDAYVFLSKWDKKLKTRYYIQPSFYELEAMDRKRLEKQWKGIGTIIEEMMLFDARLILPSGERKPIRELLEAGKSVGELLNPHKEES